MPQIQISCFIDNFSISSWKWYYKNLIITPIHSTNVLTLFCMENKKFRWNSIENFLIKACFFRYIFIKWKRVNFLIIIIQGQLLKIILYFSLCWIGLGQSYLTPEPNSDICVFLEYCWIGLGQPYLDTRT